MNNEQHYVLLFLSLVEVIADEGDGDGVGGSDDGGR